MKKCKITVLKKIYNGELVDEYAQNDVSICDTFEVGQEFIIENMSRPPEDFCSWAWIDIQRTIQTLMLGGNFKDSGWMKENNIQIVCCSDGLRPVVFKIERID